MTGELEVDPITISLDITSIANKLPENLQVSPSQRKQFTNQNEVGLYTKNPAFINVKRFSVDKKSS